MSIFVSYSSKDKQYVDSFKLEANKYKKIKLYTASKKDISIGSDFTNEIEQAIDKSDGAILLVSNNFLNSEFVNNIELPAIIKKAGEDPKYKLAPVFLDNCELDSNIYLKNLQFVNSPNTNLSNASQRVYSDIIDESLRYFKSLNIKNPLLPILFGGLLVAFLWGTILDDASSYEDLTLNEEVSSTQDRVTAADEFDNEISSAEMNAVIELNNLPERWNTEALNFVTAYIDPDISWEEFLVIGWDSYENLLAILTDGMYYYGDLESLEFESLYFPILDNYAEKLTAIEKILSSVENNDFDELAIAEEELRIASENGQKLACNMLEVMNSKYSELATEQQKQSMEMILETC